LAEAGHAVRIDRRSLKAQGIDRRAERHRGPRRRQRQERANPSLPFPTADLS
jgi:hypothetical protein